MNDGQNKMMNNKDAEVKYKNSDITALLLIIVVILSAQMFLL